VKTGTRFQDILVSFFNDAGNPVREFIFNEGTANSAKTLEAVAAHYAKFFSFVTGGFINLTPQDQADMVAFMKLLD